MFVSMVTEKAELTFDVWKKLTASFTLARRATSFYFILFYFISFLIHFFCIINRFFVHMPSKTTLRHYTFVIKLPIRHARVNSVQV